MWMLLAAIVVFALTLLASVTTVTFTERREGDPRVAITVIWPSGTVTYHRWPGARS